MSGAATTVPRAVAIITDGNGRWAQRQGLPVWEGHRQGAENVRSRLRDAVRFGIQQLSIYAFSTENWKRSSEEVDGLMTLMKIYIEHETPILHREGVRMRFIGRLTAPVPADVVELIQQAESLTAANDRITLFIPFNYGGRAEIVDAARRFSGATEQEFAELLYAPELLPPDLVIRTGGEHRISNYLLWHIADSQLVFCDELWPDFGEHEFLQALATWTAPA